jgi:hypothetical protein
VDFDKLILKSIWEGKRPRTTNKIQKKKKKEEDGKYNIEEI